MKILLTNDDGIDAPGLRALLDSVQHAIDLHRRESAGHWGQTDEIVIVAPDRCRSECSHSIETSHPLSVKTVRPNWHRVDGTPVDCIRVARYAMGFDPDVVFSGINAGANLGVNLMVSGTFAAACEASLLGIPALAVSHYRRPDVPRTWQHTPEWLAETLSEFFDTVLDRGSGTTENIDGETLCAPLWNVNLPAVLTDSRTIPLRSECRVDRCPINRTGMIEPGMAESGGRVRFELDFHTRPREEGRDVEQCFGGRITLSKLHPHTGLLAEGA